MNLPEKKKRSRRYQKPCDLEQEIIGDLAQAIIEEMQANHQKDVDPLEQYAYQLKLRLHQNPRVFRNRFVRGYQALLEELDRSKHSPS